MAVVQVVIIYGSDTWVMTLRIGGGFGQIPPQSVPQSDGETNLERTGRWMVVSPAGGSDGGGRIIGGGDLRLLLLEHSHTVHFY